MNIIERTRRLRRSAGIRDLVQENHLAAADLIWPVFIKEGHGLREAIDALPGVYRLSLDQLQSDVLKLLPLGLRGVALFPCIEEQLKDGKGREALNPAGLVPRAVRELKERIPELAVITDVALDPYSSDGHDGIVKNGEILNDETLLVLAEQATVHAEAGADFVAPSDMMDGRVGWIRKALDEAGKSNVGIISYCAKYASGFYGPFRQALESAPRFGDKKTYQMNPMNRREALREARLDIAEGADVLLVKPALSYLDVIQAVREVSDLPIAAYNVSGEFAMVKAAAAKGWLDERQIVSEILGSIKRAGADMIFSYHTPDVLHWLETD
jgi:porphobilinogen synthase